MNHKTLPALCLGLAVALGATACGGGDEDASAKESASAAQSGQADLSGVPDVVAEVNGEEISKDEFAQTYQSQYQQMSMQAQQTGQPVDEKKLRKQVADNLVGTELLSQEADKRGMEATDKEVDQSLKELAGQNGMKNPAEFMKALKKQGMSEGKIREDVGTQVQIEELLTAESGDVDPSEKELRQLYQQAKQQAGGQGVPPFEKVKPQLREQAVADQENKTAQALVTKLRKQGDVTLHL